MTEDKPDQSRSAIERIAARQGGDRAHNVFYSKLVRFLRVMLPLVVICILGILIAWPEFEEKTSARVRLSEAPVPENIKNELLNPRYEGQDEKGQPYTISAERAIQNEGAGNLALLDKPVASIRLETGETLSVRASAGEYNQESRHLELLDGVTLVYNDLYILTSRRMHMDIGSRIIWSEAEVMTTGPKGRIHARKLHADLGKDVLIFSGPAKLILNQGFEEL